MLFRTLSQVKLDTDTFINAISFTFQYLMNKLSWNSNAEYIMERFTKTLFSDVTCSDSVVRMHLNLNQLMLKKLVSMITDFLSDSENFSQLTESKLLGCHLEEIYTSMHEVRQSRLDEQLKDFTILNWNDLSLDYFSQFDEGQFLARLQSSKCLKKPDLARYADDISRFMKSSEDKLSIQITRAGKSVVTTPDTQANKNVNKLDRAHDVLVRSDIPGIMVESSQLLRFYESKPAEVLKFIGRQKMCFPSGLTKRTHLRKEEKFKGETIFDRERVRDLMNSKMRGFFRTFEAWTNKDFATLKVIECEEIGMPIDIQSTKALSEDIELDLESIERIKENEQSDPQDSDYYEMSKPLSDMMLELVFSNSYEQEEFGISIYDFDGSEAKTTEEDKSGEHKELKTEMISMYPTQEGVILGTNKGEILYLKIKENVLSPVISFKGCKTELTKATTLIGRGATYTSKTGHWRIFRVSRGQTGETPCSAAIG